MEDTERFNLAGADVTRGTLTSIAWQLVQHTSQSAQTQSRP
jgi:hypothetical protein